MGLTTKIILTKTPQLVASSQTGISYLQSRGGNFLFAFSDTTPTDLTVSYTDNKFTTDGKLGNLYVWKSADQPVTLYITNEHPLVSAGGGSGGGTGGDNGVST